jgi:hypothetical protein
VTPSRPELGDGTVTSPLPVPADAPAVPFFPDIDGHDVSGRGMGVPAGADYPPVEMQSPLSMRSVDDDPLPGADGRGPEGSPVVADMAAPVQRMPADGSTAESPLHEFPTVGRAHAAELRAVSHPDAVSPSVGPVKDEPRGPATSEPETEGTRATIGETPALEGHLSSFSSSVTAAQHALGSDLPGDSNAVGSGSRFGDGAGSPLPLQRHPSTGVPGRNLDPDQALTRDRSLPADTRRVAHQDTVANAHAHARANADANASDSEMSVQTDRPGVHEDAIPGSSAAVALEAAVGTAPRSLTGNARSPETGLTPMAPNPASDPPGPATVQRTLARSSVFPLDAPGTSPGMHAHGDPRPLDEEAEERGGGSTLDAVSVRDDGDVAAEPLPADRPERPGTLAGIHAGGSVLSARSLPLQRAVPTTNGGIRTMKTPGLVTPATLHVAVQRHSGQPGVVHDLSVDGAATSPGTATLPDPPDPPVSSASPFGPSARRRGAEQVAGSDSVHGTGAAVAGTVSRSLAGEAGSPETGPDPIATNPATDPTSPTIVQRSTSRPAAFPPDTPGTSPVRHPHGGGARGSTTEQEADLSRDTVSVPGTEDAAADPSPAVPLPPPLAGNQTGQSTIPPRPLPVQRSVPTIDRGHRMTVSFGLPAPATSQVAVQRHSVQSGRADERGVDDAYGPSAMADGASRPTTSSATAAVPAVSSPGRRHDVHRVPGPDTIQRWNADDRIPSAAPASLPGPDARDEGTQHAEDSATPAAQRSAGVVSEDTGPSASGSFPPGDPGMAGTESVPSTSGMDPARLDELAKRLFPLIARRMKAEMLLDRERRGLRTDSK